MTMATAVSHPTLKGNLNYYFSLLSKDFCNLLELWSDFRKLYICIHGWYKMNHYFLLGPKTNRMEEVAKKITDVIALIDRCMLMVDSHGYWLSKRMNKLGEGLITDSMKPFLQNAMNETTDVQTSMRNLIFEFYRMEGDLKNLSVNWKNAKFESAYQGNSNSQQSNERSSNLYLAYQVGSN